MNKKNQQEKNFPKIDIEKREAERLLKWLESLTIDTLVINHYIEVIQNESNEPNTIDFSSESISPLAKLKLILKMLGVDCNENCMLSNIKSDRLHLKVNINFNEEGDTATIILKKDFSFESVTLQEIIFSYNNVSKTYKKLPDAVEKNNLFLKEYTITNPQNDNSLNRKLIYSGAHWILSNKTESLTIIFSESELNTNQRFRDEGLFEEYLLGLTFPINIADIYLHLYNFCLDPLTAYSEIILKSITSTEDGKRPITNLMFLEEGQLKEFKITMNNIVIDVNYINDTWICQIPEYHFWQDDKGLLGHKFLTRTAQNKYSEDYLKEALNDDIYTKKLNMELFFRKLLLETPFAKENDSLNKPKEY